jgi:hypothetical protein
MSTVITQLERSVIEIENPAGSKAVVAGTFDYAGKSETAALVPIAAGSRQRLEKFSRLTLSAPEGAPQVTIRNPSPLVLEAYRETRSNRFLLGTIGIGQTWQGPIGGDEQLFLVPRVDDFIPPPPHIAEARYNRGNPLTSDDNFVSLRWTYPHDQLGHLIGYNVYFANYLGNTPKAINRLTPTPQAQAAINIKDAGVSGDINHRFAVTAVARNGVESLFSNVLILDKSSLWGMTDAGAIPL